MIDLGPLSWVTEHHRRASPMAKILLIVLLCGVVAAVAFVAFAIAVAARIGSRGKHDRYDATEGFEPPRPSADGRRPINMVGKAIDQREASERPATTVIPDPTSTRTSLSTKCGVV